MPGSFDKNSSQTLGQRIDAVLQPLYTEAEQHRSTLDLIGAQMSALQEQADAANAGLEQIESRMAEVVRALAQKEPVIAAVLGSPADLVAVETREPTTAPEAPTPAPVPAAEAAVQVPPAEAEVHSDAEAIVEVPVETKATEPTLDTQAASQPDTTEAGAVAQRPAEGAPATLDRDQQVDQAMVQEAASLLSEPPAGGATTADAAQEDAGDTGSAEQEESTPEPPADIAAAAQRAAAAAAQLKQQSAKQG